MNDVYGGPCKFCNRLHPGEICAVGPDPHFRIKAAPIEPQLTLRDRFAIAAITGTLPGASLTDDDVRQRSRWAYRVADAMLEVRGTRL